MNQSTLAEHLTRNTTKEIKTNPSTQPQQCPICKQLADFYCSKESAHYFRCPQCRTIFQHPLPSSEEMVSYANQEYSGGVYKEYVQARDLKNATFRKRMRKICDRTEGTRLLDVGCSCGYFIDVALQEGFDAYGIEFSAVAINSASEQARARIIHGDLNRLDPIQRESYDVVTAFDIIEHTLDPIHFLLDLKNILKKQGLLVLTTPDTGHFLRSLMGSRWPMLQPFQHTFLFSGRSLRLLLDEAGYTDIELISARKVLTPEYLVKQIKVHNPLVARLYSFVSWALPSMLRNRAIDLNIGEMMAFARRRD